MMRTVGLCATLAATAAQAMLIPSATSIEHDSVTAGIDPFTDVVKLPCNGCLYAQPVEDGFVWTQGIESALLLNISVGANGESLLLNDFQIYPPVSPFFLASAGAFSPAVPQIPGSVSIFEVIDHPEHYITRPLSVTSWALRTGRIQSADTGDQVLLLDLVLWALEGKDITVPTLTITALKQANGNILILKTEEKNESTPSNNRIDAVPANDNDCHMSPLLCSWRHAIAAKLSGLKAGMRRPGCHGKGGRKGPHDGHGMRPHQMRPHRRPGFSVPASELKDDMPAPLPEAEGRHREHHGQHGHRWHNEHHHGNHKGMHAFMHRFRHIIWAIVVPVALGFAIGIAAYLVGYVVGALAVFILARFVRSREGYEVVLVEEDGDDIKERDSMEKAESGYLVEEPLPVYTENEEDQK